MDFTRDELTVLHTRSAALGAALLLCDIAGYVVSIGFVAREPAWPVQLLFAGIASVFVGRLFMLGHDACHQSLTPNRGLNRALGTVAFLSSLHPYSLWDFGHNRVHHRYTNLRGLDYVWEPLDRNEYARLTTLGRLRYRLYRTPLGHFLYYGAEIWWRKMYFPRPSEIGGYCRSYVWDHVLVAAWTVLMPACLIALRHHWFGPALPWTDIAATLFFGWITPIAAFFLAMSTVIYLHHTHPTVVWTRAAQVAPDGQVKGAVHVILPGFLERTLHHIMDHTAHHARPGIPLYNLKHGQALLEDRHESVIVERWTLAFHLDTLRRCKLFDVDAQRWVGFDGRPD